MREGPASRWRDRYHREGYCAPFRVLSPEEARACRARLEAFEAAHGGPLQGDLRHRAHVFLVWLDELVRHPRILDAVEAILGENLLVWSSTLFIKERGDGTHVPWHQDSRAYGARAPDVATAWVALTDSTPENGALQVIPGSHRRGELPHVVQHVPDSLLTRRREVALGVNEAEATIIPLRAGEMSLHHPSLVHGSPTNRAADRRIGVAIRYVRPSAEWGAGPRERAMLVRGVDAAGSFDALPRPERDGAPKALARHAELMRPVGPVRSCTSASRGGRGRWRCAERCSREMDGESSCAALPAAGSPPSPPPWRSMGGPRSGASPVRAGTASRRAMPPPGTASRTAARPAGSVSPPSCSLVVHPS